MENEDLTLDFMGYKAMCHCRPIIQRLHNKRDPKIVSSEKHIDLSRTHETILDCGTIEQCYEQIFGEAVKKYNAKQKRKDRRIENYLETILNDKRQGKHKNIKADGSRKPAYEMIIQLGNRDNRPDDEKASRVLKDFCNFLIKKYPNIVPIGIYLHSDEFSIDEETHLKVFSPVHIHFDNVYVAHLGKSLKTGMDLQCSMSGALAEMGFITAKGKVTAQQQFEQNRTELDNNIESFNQKSEKLKKDIQANTEKSLDLFIKENQLSKKEKEQSSKQFNLEQQESDLQSREALVEIKESNNKYQRERNEKKEIDQKSKNAEQALQDAQIIQAENKKESKTLELEQNDLERDKSLFKSIDSEISAFKDNRSEAFTSRFNKFVGNVKKIVTAITTELNWFKAAFKDFWNKTSKDFRHLADLMDRNNCEKFSDYNKKFYNGELDYQIQEKNQIQQKHTIHQKKNNDDYEWDR